MRAELQRSVPQLLAAAGVAGVAGDYLLRGSEWRLGFALWIVLLIGGVFAIGRGHTRAPLLLMAAMLLAAFGLVWRDADMLYVIDFLSLLCMGALTLWHGSGGDLAKLTLVESVRVGIIAAVNTLGGAAAVIGEGKASTEISTTGRASAKALMIGAVLALPPLVIVARLLSSSDAVFSGQLQHILSFINANGLSHLFVIALLAWVATGWLRAAIGDGAGTSVPEPRSPGLAFASVAVGLYSQIALLGLFVVTQARVVFGGAAFLRETAGLTVANYAREGFFQLIVAAIVVLLTLAIADWLLADDDERGHRRFTIAGATLLALVTTLLVSAGVRIGLYVSEFGLTVDRTFASAGILWVAGLLGAFGLTTLRRRPLQFMPVSIVVSIVWVTLVNVVNPEAFVVHVNMSRAAQGAPFDVSYHAALSADALPSIVRAAPRLTPADCQQLDMALHNVWRARITPTPPAGLVITPRDWRALDLPIARAKAWLAEGRSICVAP